MTARDTKRRFKQLVALLPVLALGVSGNLDAQSGTDASAPAGQPKALAAPEPAPDNSPANIRVQSFLVTAPVTVINKSGDFVSDLDEKDFKLIDNGATQHIERFEISTEPIAVVIVVQTTDSVGSLLGQVQPLGPLFSDLLLAPNGEAAVLSYSDQVRELLGFTGDRDRLKATLQSLKPLGSKPRLNDAMMRGLTLLETRPKPERRIMVVFSDGTDHGSDSGEPDVVRRATTDGATIYAIHLSRAEAALRDKPDQGHPMDPQDANIARPLPPGVAPTSTNSTNTWGSGAPTVGADLLAAVGKEAISKVLKDSLEIYTRYTGGVYYTHWSETTLQDQLNRICSEVHTQYEIAYVPSNLMDSGFHAIRVEVDRPGLRVRTRAGYFYQKQVTK
ncbi:MAG TPA: VWA domain-containing protein [Terriglobia bacterium]|nr:VWA domain-containing protein [Terriglobia bacterium]